MHNFFFPKKQKVVVTPIPELSPEQILIVTLQSEINFLRDQVKTLTEKAFPKAVPNPQAQPFIPKKFDPATGTFIPKSEQEIAADMQGLRELGIL